VAKGSSVVAQETNPREVRRGYGRAILHGAMTAPRFGLCDACAHQKLIGTTRGSTFSMCRRGLDDPDWPKYPPMPVLRCPRYAPRERAA
jgi:hypothetical protein